MDEATDAGLAGGLGHGAGTLDVDGLEGLAAALEPDGDAVDDEIGALHGATDRVGIAQIGLHRHHLADDAHRLQEPGEVRPALGRAHPPAAPSQRPDHMPTDETRSAENYREARAVRSCHGNSVLPPVRKAGPSGPAPNISPAIHPSRPPCEVGPCSQLTSRGNATN